MRRLLWTLLLVSLPLMTSCGALALGARQPRFDPTVRLHTGEGGELGVATDYGIVFLGRGARSGIVEYTAWFGDGPSLEEGIVEPVGGGLFVIQPEIRLASAPLTFADPPAGTRVLVRGRSERGPWTLPAQVARDPAVEGLLLRPSSGLAALGDDQVGAGVYLLGEDGRRLLGLLSGRLRLSEGGGEREYLTVAGPRELWRVVTHQRNLHRPDPPLYREDVLPR